LRGGLGGNQSPFITTRTSFSQNPEFSRATLWVPSIFVVEVQILGVPLGSQEFTESFVKRDLLDVAEGVMSKLIDFEDTQAAIFLLRLSFGIVRATHFMRTTPLSLWSKQAGEFDEKVSQTVFQCLGLKPTDAQASVSTTIGGLGVRRILDHANGAFTASWQLIKNFGEGVLEVSKL